MLTIEEDLTELADARFAEVYAKLGGPFAELFPIERAGPAPQGNSARRAESIDLRRSDLARQELDHLIDRNVRGLIFGIIGGIFDRSKLVRPGPFPEDWPGHRVAIGNRKTIELVRSGGSSPGLVAFIPYDEGYVEDGTFLYRYLVPTGRLVCLGFAGPVISPIGRLLIHQNPDRPDGAARMHVEVSETGLVAGLFASIRRDATTYLMVTQAE